MVDVGDTLSYVLCRNLWFRGFKCPEEQEKKMKIQIKYKKNSYLSYEEFEKLLVEQNFIEGLTFYE